MGAVPSRLGTLLWRDGSLHAPGLPWVVGNHRGPAEAVPECGWQRVSLFLITLHFLSPPPR